MLRNHFLDNIEQKNKKTVSMYQSFVLLWAQAQNLKTLNTEIEVFLYKFGIY